jgi:hypothetical protein
VVSNHYRTRLKGRSVVAIERPRDLIRGRMARLDGPAPHGARRAVRDAGVLRLSGPVANRPSEVGGIRRNTAG